MNTTLGRMKIAAKNAGITLKEYQQKRNSGLKRCTKCKEWKPNKEYGRDSTRSDKLDAKCLECRHVRIKKPQFGRPPYFKGHHHTEEAKRIISEKAKGRPSKQKGTRRTPEQRLNISNGTKIHAARGINNHRWKGGISPETQEQRHSFEYREWRRQVFERDHFVCQNCGYNKGHILIAHHIKPFSKNPELRYDVNNGITICKICHQFLHSN